MFWALSNVICIYLYFADQRTVAVLRIVTVSVKLIFVLT